jgi:anti-sigma regulatory factor (Ser/Thr protein kinase)
LTFGLLDDLAFAGVVAKARLLDVRRGSVFPTSLGPLIELLLLVSAGTLPTSAVCWLNSTHLAEFLKAWSDGRQQWLSETSHFGFIRTRAESETWRVEATGFLIKAQQAARQISRLPGSIPGQMAAAIAELEGNIQEHSDAASTGALVFRATSNVFEFVVADRGIGILESLRSSPEYCGLDDHGRALEMALTEGTSRFKDPGRGHGFRPIFQGLTELEGYLRFRTGDGAIVMDGTSPTLATAQLFQKPSLNGFLASVRCENKPLVSQDNHTAPIRSLTRKVHSSPSESKQVGR